MGKGRPTMTPPTRREVAERIWLALTEPVGPHRSDGREWREDMNPVFDMGRILAAIEGALGAGQAEAKPRRPKGRRK